VNPGSYLSRRTEVLRIDSPLDFFRPRLPIGSGAKSSPPAVRAQHNPRVSSPPLIALLLYLAAVLAIGFLWRRRAGRDEISYFGADRSLDTF